jgi:hypothetical protein
MSSAPEITTAEQRFRQAFERLKAGKPNILVPGAPVTQNNVAREAGCDPSGLRKQRFPALIREIQAFVELERKGAPSKRQVQLGQRKVRQDLKLRLAEVATQRDQAQSQLVSAHRRIVELTDEVKSIKIQLDGLRPPPVVFPN